MGKSSKNKNKVPKITEAEYAQYLSALKSVSPKESFQQTAKDEKPTSSSKV